MACVGITQSLCGQDCLSVAVFVRQRLPRLNVLAQRFSQTGAVKLISRLKDFSKSAKWIVAYKERVDLFVWSYGTFSVHPFDVDKRLKSPDGKRHVLRDTQFVLRH